MFKRWNINSRRTKERRRSRYDIIILAIVLVLLVIWLLLSAQVYHNVEDGAGNDKPLGESTNIRDANNNSGHLPHRQRSYTPPLFVDGNIPPNVNSIFLPHRYPVHENLPGNSSDITAALYEKKVTHQEECWRSSSQSPIFPSPPSLIKEQLQPVYVEKSDLLLRQEFQFLNNNNNNNNNMRNNSLSKNETFYLGYDTPSSLNNKESPWWVSSGSHLPCTASIQRRLYEYENLASCEERTFLLSDIKAGGYGLGGSLVLLAFDFLNAMILGRTLVIGAPSTVNRWKFLAEGCFQNGIRALDCFYLPPTRCNVSNEPIHNVRTRTQAVHSSARVIRKKTFEMPDLNRDSIPTDEAFFGPGYQEWSCYPEYLNWINNPANMVVQGTFKSGIDTRLYFMLAQVFMYLTRAPQPWFQQMIYHHLSPLGILSTHENEIMRKINNQCTIYIQDRGEEGKMREYYNVFGCHTVGLSLYRDYVRTISTSTELNSSKIPCSVFVSGGTPLQSFLWLKKQLEEYSYPVMSTWNLSTLSAGAESVRWGASSPAASWVDMYAGVASTNWVCMVQSNWCRVIDFLRMTHGRKNCGFIDIGILLLTSVEFRKKYCVIGDFPTKPFSNVIRK
ncbi:uncharacterized protein TM35_000014010 [Trypanosoma theileri]|uniref:Uncharacterized protein n=1 Tax=Trypanosoma theileri TaxID=67003 RepID=A0A1X0P9C0_9TRYP|nr:uncharacterized protein TM35_000014010 [Trypanosoma theileri]ORC93524.1 hypothetical protein TM35_000014010 [Trypanosoma theileri]